MKPPPFEYVAPADLQEALRLLAEHGDNAKILAGGQSLVPLLNFRLAGPETLIDVNRVPGLASVERRDGFLTIGALARQRTLERSPLVRAAAPLLRLAALHVAHPQIRNAGTVGGSVVHADPTAELPCALSALDAHFVAASTRERRTIAWQDFFVGPLENSLAPDEMLLEIVVPVALAGTRSSFREYSRRSGDFALGGAAVTVQWDQANMCRDASIALLGAGATPYRATEAEKAMIGLAAGDLSPDDVAEAAVAGISPRGDLHAGTQYRIRLIRSMVRRALTDAWAPDVIPPDERSDQ